MQISLYFSTSEKNKISKNLTNEVTYSGDLRDSSNVVQPIILVACENPTAYNYAYIPAFKRYYFITEMTSVRKGIWTLSLKSDVLMSFKSGILASSVIVNESTSTGNNYLDGRNWVANCKKTTQVVKFPSGLNDTGEYILITAGG